MIQHIFFLSSDRSFALIQRKILRAVVFCQFPRVLKCRNNILRKRSGLDGFHVLQKLRQTSDIPVIIISAKDTDPDKILGLDLGADDYIAKPFNPLEAMARVRSNLRRYAARTGTAETEGSSGHRTLSHKDLVLDLDACCIYKNDERIDLTSVEFRIMNMFMASPGKVFTKQQIYENGWGDAYITGDNSIMVCISKLRTKLGDSEGEGEGYIRTIRGLGYRLEP